MSAPNEYTIAEPGEPCALSATDADADVPQVGSVEISVRGQWKTVPALHVDGRSLIVTGSWLKRAVVNAEEWLESDVQDPAACVAALKRQKGPLKADVFSFVQKLPAVTPKYPYRMEWHSVAAAHIPSFKEWWDKLPQETRKNVRRATKRGVVLAVKTLDDDLVKQIIEVNNDSPIRQNIPFVHYGKTFEQVKKDQSSYFDRSEFICAYVGDELIGFIKVVYRGQVASILQILPRASHADKRPANAMIAKAVERCEEKGVSYLTYGMLNYGNKKDSSLRDFKLRNGFAEILVPRYYVPLTRWGAVCMRLNLHRGLHGMLPPGVISGAVKIRARWYNLRKSMGRCSSTDRAAES